MGREQGGDPLELSPREKLERDVKAAKARQKFAEHCLATHEAALTVARREVAESAARVADAEAGLKVAEQTLAEFDAYERTRGLDAQQVDGENDPQRMMQRQAEAANTRWWNEFQP